MRNSGGGGGGWGGVRQGSAMLAVGGHSSAVWVCVYRFRLCITVGMSVCVLVRTLGFC